MEHTDAGVHSVLADVERPADLHPHPETGPDGPVTPSLSGAAEERIEGLDDVNEDQLDQAVHAGGGLAAGEGRDGAGEVALTGSSFVHGMGPSCGPGRSDSLADVIDIGLGDLLGEAMEWQERALCAQTDPEAFFPEKGGSTREAKRICSGCEVRVECLEYALENDERFGIWGGMSERERRKQRRRAV